MRQLAIRPRRNDLASNIDGFFSNFFDTPAFWSDSGCCYFPPVDIHETKDDLFLTFELPGMEKDEIKVGVESNILTVSGERKTHQEENGQDFIRSEIRHGSFSRSFTLPKTVDLDKISADYKNGLLEIRLAKVEEAKPKEVKVKIS